MATGLAVAGAGASAAEARPALAWARESGLCGRGRDGFRLRVLCPRVLRNFLVPRLRETIDRGFLQRHIDAQVRIKPQQRGQVLRQVLRQVL